MLIAETTALTGCAYGSPVRGDGPWWEGFDGYLPGRLLRFAASGRLFVISGIHVPSRVRRQNQDRTVEALRSWGWRYTEGDTPRTASLGPFRVLVLET
ncbi:hypothetical protein [Streptomyces coeruleorubidus]|uniref:hypothetical protein n=1 Tax=Streptomyces coeruleorubidus TaxID=116188 RepID=UPI0036CE596B